MVMLVGTDLAVGLVLLLFWPLRWVRMIGVDTTSRRDGLVLVNVRCN
jgi:hypothetical protein